MLSTGYDKVLKNMNAIITALKINPVAKNQLTGKYEENKWIDIATDPTEKQLVNMALNRIQQDPNQYDMFIDMLRDIPGMDLTADRITSC